jgi:hypothetical protein
MKDTRAGDRITFLLLGTAIGAGVALGRAGVRYANSPTLRRKGEDAADYVVDAGKELAERCEDLYKRRENWWMMRRACCPRNIASCISEARNWRTRPQYNRPCKQHSRAIALGPISSWIVGQLVNTLSEMLSARRLSPFARKWSTAWRQRTMI